MLQLDSINEDLAQLDELIESLEQEKKHLEEENLRKKEIIEQLKQEINDDRIVGIRMCVLRCDVGFGPAAASESFGLVME